MPEYLAPGVFVEETSFRSKSIEGVSTSTAAFVGLTRFGPSGEEPELLTSFGDFEDIYGGLGDLAMPAGIRATNFLAHAAAAYFAEGGARLYVSRVVPGGAVAAQSEDLDAGAGDVRFVARFPGSAGNGRIILDETRVPSSVVASGSAPIGSLMFVRTKPANAGDILADPLDGDHFVRQRDGTWADSAAAARVFQAADEAVVPTTVNGVTESLPGMELVTLNAVMIDGDRQSVAYEDLGFDPAHPRFVGSILAEMQTSRAANLALTYALRGAPTVAAAPTTIGLRDILAVPFRQTRAVSVGSGLNGQIASGAVEGTDGVAAPTVPEYATALSRLLPLDDVSIVAAPGAAAYAGVGDGVNRALITHVEQRRAYRIAVLDTAPGLTPGEARQAKAQVDSTRAAMYYPWIWISNPLASGDRPEVPKELLMPPSGFICGIYARSDIERGVFKAPANEVVRSALRFERLVTTGEQELLNPLGVNCLRHFAGRGYRVWGARTTSSDPEWKYVNIRRYFNYLEHSIDRGTQWAVFEPNGERLWANVKETITSFLYNEWVSGALLGTTPEQAFFVRCDRSTITQNDLDNGRLICLIGVAAIKPAEFVIFRIGQKTADAK